MPDKRQGGAKRAMGVMRDDGIISNNLRESGLSVRAFPQEEASDKCDRPQCPG